MIIPVAALVVLLLPAVIGGRLRRLAGVRLRLTWLVGLALVIQIVVIEVFTRPQWLLGAVHVGTYLAAGAFLWANRRVPGMVVLALGAMSNGLAISLNGGTLPASAEALRRAGIDQRAHEFTNSGVLDGARLGFLGDVFAIPAGWPLSNVFSIGDVWIVLGVGYASLRICGSRWTPAWSPRAAGHGTPRHLASGPVRERKPSGEVSGEVSGKVSGGAPGGASGGVSGSTAAGGEGDASGRPHLPRQRRRALRDEATHRDGEPAAVPDGVLVGVAGATVTPTRGRRRTTNDRRR